VAAVASRRQRSGIIIGMALRAGNSCQMRPSQRKFRRAVVESGRCPIRSRMADRTVCWEPGGDVVRDIGPVCARSSFCPYIYVAVVTYG
jgi:hypothetical protein